MTSMNIGTGAFPCIRPRPKYPSFSTILFHFVHLFVLHQGLVGAFLVYLLTPFYQRTRQLAKTKAIDDAVYFSIVICALHTLLYIVINLRKY